MCRKALLRLGRRLKKMAAAASRALQKETHGGNLACDASLRSAKPSSCITGYNIIMTVALSVLPLTAHVQQCYRRRQIPGTPVACSIAEPTFRLSGMMTFFAFGHRSERMQVGSGSFDAYVPSLSGCFDLHRPPHLCTEDRFFNESSNMKQISTDDPRMLEPLPTGLAQENPVD